MFFSVRNLIFALLCCTVCQSLVRYEKKGDLMLGGLFPLHEYNHTLAQCGSLLGLNALKMVEAMVFAVEEVNRNETILPNITVGFEIYDTCNYPSVTLESTLHFIPSQREFICRHSSGFQVQSLAENKSCPDPGQCAEHIVGVIGARRSSCSVQATTLLGLYWIPQISYMSTDDELSNTAKYPYFLRTVPPSRYQVKAMIDVLHRFNWTFVSALHSDDNYGQNGIAVFERLASQKGICIGASVSLSSRPLSGYYEDVVRALEKYANAKVVIVFAQPEHVQYLMTAVERSGASGKFIWLASDGWGNYGLDAITGNERAATGALMLRQYAVTAVEFEKHFHSMCPFKSDNPWMQEFVQQYGDDCVGVFHNSSNGNATHEFKGFLNDSDTVHQESLVIDSVLAFVHSMDLIYREHCQGHWDAHCVVFMSNGKLLIKYLLSESFTGPNGYVRFDQNGDVRGRYFIDQIQRTSDRDYEVVTVGGWWAEFEDEGTLDIRRELQWCNRTHCVHSNEHVPESVCSKPCQFGQAKMVTVQRECCWVCIQCQSWQIVADNGTTCRDCSAEEEYSWPNEEKTECEQIAPSYFHITDTAGIFLATLTSVGIVLTICSVAFYISYNEHLLIKASSRELSYIILAGVLVAYIINYTFMMTPSTAVCFGQRWIGLAMAMIYGTLTTKTNRVYRIFKSGKTSAKRPRFISPCSQVIIASIIISVQVVLIVIALVIQPPAAVLSMPDPTRPFVELRCADTEVAFFIYAFYSLILISVCSYEAFKTRRLPNNYNESKFITFDIFTSLVVLLAFMPSYVFSISAAHVCVYVIMASLIDAYVTLACLFLPKIYAVKFVSEGEMHLGYGSSYRSAFQAQAGQTNQSPDRANRVNPEGCSGTDVGGKNCQICCCCQGQTNNAVDNDEDIKSEEKANKQSNHTVTKDSDI
ncbi:metabotropic glutamate receptor 3-like [Ptychodera flava]|uniref:metabotropic glutamate receptor 3-like n=1 Tax=Ptychodera flava TaxID=63121 RepID=UPI003969F082